MMRHIILLRRFASRTDKLTIANSSSINTKQQNDEDEEHEVILPPSDNQVLNSLESENVAEAAMMMFQRLISPSSDSDRTNPRREHLLRVNTDSLVIKTYSNPSLDRYNLLISSQSESGDLEAALRSFERMRSIHDILPDERTFVSLLRACKLNRDSDRALAIIESLEHANITPSDTMYSILGQIYALNQETTKLYELHSRLTDEIERKASDEFDLTVTSPLWNVSLTTAVLSSLIKEGTGVALRQAWELFDEFRMGHGKPDKYMLSCMISACGFTGEAERAISLFEEFEIDSMDKPPAAAFAGIMRACARSRIWNREAFTYFDRMIGNGHDVNVETMTILIDACALTGDADSAKKLVQAIEAHPRLEMNEYVYTAMLNTYARGMRPRKATKDHWAVPTLRNPRRGLPDGVKLGYDTDGTARDEHNDAETLHFLQGKRNNRPQIFQKYDAYDYAMRKGDWSEHPAFDGLNSELLPEHEDPLMSALLEDDHEESTRLLTGDVEEDGLADLDAMAPVEDDVQNSDDDMMMINSVNEFLQESDKMSKEKEETHPERQKRFIEESRELFKRAVDDIEITTPILNAYLKVHSEALRLGTFLTRLLICLMTCLHAHLLTHKLTHSLIHSHQ